MVVLFMLELVERERLGDVMCNYDYFFVFGFMGFGCECGGNSGVFYCGVVGDLCYFVG